MTADLGGHGEVRVITRPARLAGELAVPGDKSISHRALILNAMAYGVGRVSGAFGWGGCAVDDGLFAGVGG